MKHITCICIFLLSVSFCIAQKTSSDIRESITAHMKAMEVKDYETALDHYYKKYFNLIMSRTEFLQKLLEMDNNDMLIGRNKLSKIISVSDIVTVDAIKYAFVTYEAHVSITYKDTVEEEVVLYVRQQIEAKENNVSYDKEKREITYYRNSDCIMILDNGWKLLPYSKKLAPFVKTMIPKAAIEKLNISE
ncbi:MAG: hypothetical protein AAF611_00205 [Bacteroidota bacterium]